jgi:hypothetical protein
LQEGRRANIKTPNQNQFDVLRNQNENQPMGSERNEAGILKVCGHKVSIKLDHVEFLGL